MDLAKVIRQALEYWGNPALTELPPETVTASANRCISGRGLDLDLTPDACFSTVKSETFEFGDPDSREYDVSTVVDDVSRVLRVESRPTDSDNEDDWQEETIASYENWNDVAERGDDNFCSFYRNTDGFFIVVARDVSNYNFRIIYKQLRDRITTPQEIDDLPDVYEPLLVYDLALDFGELIDNRSPEFMAMKKTKIPYLEGRLQEAAARIEKWQRSHQGNSVTTRRAFSDRRPTFGNTGNRKFTVRF